MHDVSGIDIPTRRGLAAAARQLDLGVQGHDDDLAGGAAITTVQARINAVRLRYSQLVLIILRDREREKKNAWEVSDRGVARATLAFIRFLFSKISKRWRRPRADCGPFVDCSALRCDSSSAPAVQKKGKASCTRHRPRSATCGRGP